MQDMGDDDRKAVLGEALMDELKAIRDGIADLPTRTELNELKDEVIDLRTDVKAIKAAIKFTNKDFQDHENRITLLEQAA